MPIDFDDYLDVLFLYWVEDPIAYEHDDLFYILGVSQLLMIYVYACFVLGVDPQAHDWRDVLCWVRSFGTLEWFMNCVEQEALENMSTYLCVEREALEHMRR